jgi:hypothetical protein
MLWRCAASDRLCRACGPAYSFTATTGATHVLAPVVERPCLGCCQCCAASTRFCVTSAAENDPLARSRFGCQSCIRVDRKDRHRGRLPVPFYGLLAWFTHRPSPFRNRHLGVRALRSTRMWDRSRRQSARREVTEFMSIPPALRQVLGRTFTAMAISRTRAFWS